MAFKDTSIRVGAATFALGLALAGPQATGVAAADRGDTDANFSAAADDRGDARGGPEVSASDQDGDVTSVPTDEPTTTDQDFAAEEPPAEDTDPATEDPAEDPSTEDPSAETLPGSDDEPVLDDPTDDNDEPTAEEPGTQEPDVFVDPEPPAEEPDPATEDPAEDPSAETLLGSDDEPVPDDLLDDVGDEPIAEESGTQEPVVSVDPEPQETPVTDDTEERPRDPEPGDAYEPVVLPGRGGPDPLPWWRTTTTVTDGAAGDEPSLPEPEPVPDAKPVDQPVWLYSVGTDSLPGGPAGGSPVEPPKLSATNTAAVGNQAIDPLMVQITAVIDQVVEWLNNLPANPVTEFMSGALLLLRRALIPDAPTRTDDPGNSISDPETETEIPGGLVGLTEDEAVQAAAGAGWTTRIVSRDGEDFMITKDYLLTRVNFTVVSGVVTAVYVG